ncbi:polyprenyl synthetase family protein [Streptomyces sp. NBC_01077]|uniref:hypothetical protein n=1 Tax=Streptomyces sp. NBC_01077 TaxID=2903746 RepID=UPI00386DFB2A|nr:polyprenyl synthetase family protein [Streptomyces sp. NBC_01077]WSV43616.1 polyprenyl synthetase family protein [Streptomyces sp. NBC_01077]
MKYISNNSQIRFPENFKGIFEPEARWYEERLTIARRDLCEMPIPEGFRTFFDFITERSQPSFILLPILFLEVARESGGITERHQEFLPVLMLSMEMIAVMDDTIDGSNARSEHLTFPGRWGAHSSTPCVAVLMSMLMQQIANGFPSLLDLALESVRGIGAKELREEFDRYPRHLDDFPRILENRYGQAIDGYHFVISSALRLNGKADFPRASMVPFARIGQDVDDLVNVIEDREKQGENDDLRKGLVTAALLQALRQRPELAVELRELWHLRTETRLRRLDNLHRSIRTSILAHGVMPVIDQIAADVETCEQAAPVYLQKLMRRAGQTWLDRVAGFSRPVVTKDA